jgi:hypothetical protein
MLTLAGCDEPERWEGYAHSDPNNPAFYEYIGTHDSLAGCFRMGYAFLNFRGSLGSGHYECGLNCRWYEVPGGVVKRCDRVEQGSADPRQDRKAA